MNGGIAQLARACGSYPQCRWFNSNYRYHMARWSRGEDTALSRRYREFDSRTGHQKRIPVLESVFLRLRKSLADILTKCRFLFII